MPFYHKLGSIPHKRHTVFEKEDGGMYYEQLFGTEGFHGFSSLLYHTQRPTQVKSISEPKDVTPVAAVAKNISSRMLRGFDVKPTADFLESRVIVMFNNDLNIAVAAPQKSLREPRGIIYQIEFDTEDNRLFIVESFSPVLTPRNYRNGFGQLLEHSPFCERDLRAPHELETHNENGDFLIKIKKENVLHEVVYASHPFDVVGWDGFNFPYAFSIHDFEPITGRVHQPPPVHQTFEAHNFVICSFCPRLYDYHPKSIPAPYNHSNIDSDEVLYYVDGDFMSRNHVEKGYMSLHPGGIPHGPHPGAMERSIGQKETAELAVMVDTFKPLKLTQAALDMQDESYVTSWL